VYNGKNAELHINLLKNIRDKCQFNVIKITTTVPNLEIYFKNENKVLLSMFLSVVMSPLTIDNKFPILCY
jgi:hypothetical protein